VRHLQGAGRADVAGERDGRHPGSRAEQCRHRRRTGPGQDEPRPRPVGARAEQGAVDSRAAGGGLKRFSQLVARPHWLWDVGIRGRPHSLGNLEEIVGRNAPLDDFQAWIHANFDPSVSWKDVEWVRKRWPGPLIIKGLLDPDDARAAAASGAEAIVVSNHGGRQLDGVVSTAAALPRIAEAAEGRVKILADGGVRSGLDVARMLAIGADFVLLGRAWAYALAAGGGTEVERMLELVEAELRVAMALTGVTGVSEMNGDLIDRAK